MRGKLPQYSHDIVDDCDGLKDLLRRMHLAHKITDAVRQHPHPKVIGVYGSWGAGKSYLLSLTINEILRGNKQATEQIIVCPFKPWEYEAEGNLALGLIKTLREVDTYFPGRNPATPSFGRDRRIHDIAKKLLTVMAQVLTNSGDLRLEVAGGAMKTALQHLTEENNVKTIRELMQQLVNTICDDSPRRGKPRKRRLVVVIDDLDRCSPQHMVSMFEWLKNHLNVEGVTYVLALDHVAAARAIVGAYAKYLGKDEDLAYGFRYLEKLVEWEYELEDVTRVERMAIEEIYADDPYAHMTSISAIARDIAGGDFPGIGYIEQLIELRTLRVPRTMLKIVRRFQDTMSVIASSPQGFKGRLPASYPFWTLFLISINYRLDPETLADFVDGRSKLYQLLANKHASTELADEEWAKEWQTGPKLEVWQFAETLKRTGGRSLSVPSIDTLQALAAIIREGVIVSNDDIQVPIDLRA